CHTHKFDPITQDEYYGMFAFINNAYEAQSWVYTADQQAQVAKIKAAIQAIEDRERSQRPSWQQELAAWERDVLKQQANWTPLDFVQLECISGLNHPVQQADKSLLMLGHPSVDVFMVADPKLTDLQGATGLRIEALVERDLPFAGPGRSKTGSWDMLEAEAFVRKPGAKDWEKLKLVNATADFSNPEKKNADGKKS